MKTTNSPKFATNQLVRGVRAGAFVVLSHRAIDGEQYYQLKAVNPANPSEVARGELSLPETALKDW